MKTKMLVLFAILAASSAQASTAVTVYRGSLPYPYSQTVFGYNADAGKAWVIIESGQYSSVDGGQIWDSAQKELAVEGLSYDSATREIKFNGVACARARLSAFMSMAEYPVKNYGICRFSNKTETSAPNFKGETSVINTVTLEVRD